jgi:hypothetical protein
MRGSEMRKVSLENYKIVLSNQTYLSGVNSVLIGFPPAFLLFSHFWRQGAGYCSHPGNLARKPFSPPLGVNLGVNLT